MDGFGLGAFLAPACPVCGSLVGNQEAHAQFHDSMAFLYQTVTGLSDEEYDAQMTQASDASGKTAAERDARLAAALERLMSQRAAAPQTDGNAH